MIPLLLILFFILYSLFVFLLNNIWIILGCTCFNILLMIVLWVNPKKSLLNLIKILPLLIIVFSFNLIFESVVTSAIITWKLVIVANFSFLFSQRVNPTMLAIGLSLLFFPLKLFKINTNDIVIIIVIALNLLPVFSKEAKQLKMSLKSRNIKFNLKTVVTKGHMIFAMFFGSVFRRVGEIEYAMLARNYGK